jgi:formylglycine-generating enzyme required for sulfatase activity
LPTEGQWEYACRAGTNSPFFYGDCDSDWSKHANLADEKLREFVCDTYSKQRKPWLHASKYDDWIPKDTRLNDGGFLSDGVGKYLPNAFGLFDMHGNVSEWTLSDYKPYPYQENDGRNSLSPDIDKVVRGGSWRDRPKRARSAFRLAYRSYQPIYNVGFRVVCYGDPENAPKPDVTAKKLGPSFDYYESTANYRTR